MKAEERINNILQFLSDNNKNAYTASEIATRLHDSKRHVKTALAKMAVQRVINKTAPQSIPVPTHYWHVDKMIVPEVIAVERVNTVDSVKVA